MSERKKQREREEAEREISLAFLGLVGALLIKAMQQRKEEGPR